jgi:hypothetical protein
LLLENWIEAGTAKESILETLDLDPQKRPTAEHLNARFTTVMQFSLYVNQKKKEILQQDCHFMQKFCLTHPSAGVHNDGYDNVDGAYIVYKNDLLVPSKDQM